MVETLQLSDLDSQNCGVLRESSSTRPTVWVVEENGVRAVVKDYSTNGFVYRNTIGRFLIWRESKAYSRLRGINNIPTFYSVIDSAALVIEEVQGKALASLTTGETIPKGFFQELRQLVEIVHGRGVAHCDLKASTNILLSHDGHPYIVDWAASISARECRFFPLNLVYERFLEDDFLGVVKLQLQHSPNTVSPEARARYYGRGRVEKIMRQIRDGLRVILKKVA
jgi:serine/threonine protein kinase